MSLTYAKVVAASLSPCGKIMLSIESRFPRLILSEVNTHRDKSKNSASSRAIPILKQIARCLSEPFVPAVFTTNQKGMQGGVGLVDDSAREAEQIWLDARDDAVKHAQRLADLGVHKQYANRLMEPFQYHTAILSGTEWANMLAQRCHPDAQPEFQELAHAIYEAYITCKPMPLCAGQWHLPYITADDRDEAIRLSFGSDPLFTDAIETLIRVSVARCARVSYMTQAGVRDLTEDLKLWDRLLSGGHNGHWSPLEHVAQALNTKERSGNLIGFKQLRKFYDQENVATYSREAGTLINDDYYG